MAETPRPSTEPVRQRRWLPWMFAAYALVGVGLVLQRHLDNGIVLVLVVALHLAQWSGRQQERRAPRVADRPEEQP